jgi:hypothetical protein
MVPRLRRFRAAAGQRSDDPRFGAIQAALSQASAEFRDWWAEYPIRSFRPATIGLDHPRAGRIDLEMFQVRLVEHPDLIMVMQVPASPADLRRMTSLLEPDAAGDAR